MNGFDLAFGLYALVLGLSITELLGHFSRTLRVRSRVRVGWLVPLLGLFVLLDLLEFWRDAFDARASLPLNDLTLIVLLAIVGSYYLIASWVFPDDPAAWPDYDDYYLRHHRVLVGGILALQLVKGLGNTLVDGGAASRQVISATSWLGLLLLSRLPLLAALAWTRSRRVSAALLATLVATYLAGAVAVAA